MENFEYINRQPFYKQHWVLPIVLAIVVLPILAMLPWQSQKIEYDERHEQLIVDSLWVEQSIRSVLNKDEDLISALADDIISQRISRDQVGARITAMLVDRPELQEIIWFDENDRVRYSSAPTRYIALSSASRTAMQHAHASTLPQYSQPSDSRVGDRVMLMDFHFPLNGKGGYAGTLVARYNVPAILARVVPWWFAKDHEVSVIDADEVVVADRNDIGTRGKFFAHNKNLDLPGVNLMLRTNTARDYPNHFSALLISLVVFLGFGLCWSLWALWRDIVRRNTAETALRTEMAFRKAMENSSIAGLRVRGMDGTLVYVNAAFCDMVGCTQQQLLGQKYPYSFWTPDASEDFSKGKQLSETLNGYETAYKHADGRRIPVLIYESALNDENGTQIGWLGSILDISERKRAEQALRHHEERLHRNARLSTMGELASAMAHELNQPLTAINTYASGVVHLMDTGDFNADAIRPALLQMQKQAVRAAEIIRSVREFVAKRNSARKSMQIEEVIKTVTPLIELQAKSFLVRLAVNVQSPLPDVLIDPVGLEQVMLNLTRNALQSMQTTDVDNRALQINVTQNDTFIRIEVIDNGPGIPQDIAERLNTPFFSNDADEPGMGLNICRTIIELHGGRLMFEENPGGGTISSFQVPLTGDVV